MADIATIRVRNDDQQVRWVLFVDGIPYAWSTDAGTYPGGSVLGSGASSWIGLSEAAIGGVEDVGARTVLPGLEVPGTIRKGVDVKSGDLEPNPVTFRLHDTEGVLADLFAREKPFDILRERIGAGLTATSETALGQGGGLITIWGRNVGIERVGAAGERRLFPALPYSLVGFEHPVQQDEVPPAGLPPIKVSDDPIQWAGRLVTLYEIYRDPDSTATTAAAWPTWDLQAANRVWEGKLIGVRRVRGQTFEIQCHGPDALYRKQLATTSTSGWMPVTAELNHATGEDYIAVYFDARGYNVGDLYVFNGSIFQHQLTETTKQLLASEIDGIIQDTYDGTSTNYSVGDGNLDAWAVAAVDQNATVTMESEAAVKIRKEPSSSNQYRLAMSLVLHSRVWRQLGYEPESQNFPTQSESTDEPRHILFTRLANGEVLGELGGYFVANTGFAAPADGYWVGRFTTVRIGSTESNSNSNDWDNDGIPRTWLPKFSGEPFTIDLQGNQIVRLGGQSPYIEGDRTIAPQGLDVDGTASDQARYFAIRGKVQRDDESEVEDTIQVVRCEWAEGTTYGSIGVGTGALPAIRTEKFMDPRIFGFNHRKLEGLNYWTATSTGDGKLEIQALSSYAYRDTDDPEFAVSIFSQILLSTGSSPGWTGLMHSDGANGPADVYADIRYWGSDVHNGDMGCGIPYQLVMPQSGLVAAFNTVPGGWNGNLNRVRHAYLGPFLAQDVIASLLRPRRLMWSLHGGVFGVVRLGMFSPSQADVVITEDDLFPTEVGDPRSLMPEQEPNPVGHLDGLVLQYGYDPEQQKTTEARRYAALDSEAAYRTGELEETISDLGLVPWEKWGPWEPGQAKPWEGAVMQLWSREAADFFSQDHYAITVNVSRPKGQDLQPGTRVVLSNPWPADNAGSYGITNHVGVVTAVEINTASHARLATIFVFAGQAQGAKHHGMMARIVEQSGSTLTLLADQYGHGNATITDADGITEPWWSTAGGDLVVQVMHRIGETWTIESTTYTVDSFNAETMQVTLSGTPPTRHRYCDRWLIAAPYASQGVGEYPRAIFGWVVRDDLTHGAANTAGRPFHS